jgi:tetratricopeptide (TPR) repeat protein
LPAAPVAGTPAAPPSAPVAAAPAAVATAPAAAAPAAPAAAPATAPPAAPVATAKKSDASKVDTADDAKPGDYKKLIAQADHLSENGKSSAARSLYEKALTANPQGVEALTGLGYVDLDQEHFLQATDHFKQALAIVPEHGEALIGLAEVYKTRGDKAHALEFYKRYLKAQPGGAKAGMAKNNIRDLEPHVAPSETTVAPAGEKPEKKSEELPRPPPSADEPPP